MKILIWIVCMFGYGIIVTAIKNNTGISLGALPTVVLFGCASLLAIRLCKQFDRNKSKNQHSNNICDNKKHYNNNEISSSQTNYENVDAEESENPQNLESYNLKDVSKKVKFCSRCGSIIDNKTKKCTGCEKQYFSGIKLLKTAYIAGAFLGVFLIVFSAILYRDNVVLQKTINAQQNEITHLEEQNNLGFSDWCKLRFYQENIVLISNDGTKKYHKFDCEDFDKYSFLAYDAFTAAENGYSACQKCY